MSGERAAAPGAPASPRRRPPRPARNGPAPPGRLRCDHCLLEFPEREAVREPARSPAGQDGGRSGAGGTPLADGGGTSSEGRGAGLLLRRLPQRLRARPRRGARRVLRPARVGRGRPRRAARRRNRRVGVRGRRLDGGDGRGSTSTGSAARRACGWWSACSRAPPACRFARVNYATHRATVRFDPAASLEAQVLARDPVDGLPAEAVVE